MNTRIYIDAQTNMPYGSFYIKGLIDMFGRKNVKFNGDLFKNLAPVGWNIRFIIKQKDKYVKVFIQTNDTYKIDVSQYTWSDIYGQVNANFNYFPKKDYPKIISLTPSFGIRNFSLFDTIFFSFVNCIKSNKEIQNIRIYNKFENREEANKYKNYKYHFSSYLKNYLYRLPLEAYKNDVNVEGNYIFFLSTLWYNDKYNKNDEGVNLHRSRFIDVCKKLKNCEFEGGFVAGSLASRDLFKSNITDERLDFSHWIDKTKKSTLVFNTPAFWECHGWKLGEYLALGKAIVSTPLSNDLPAPLVHGKHIHIIPNTSKKSIQEAVVYILDNPDYRKSLENNAKKYWEKYGTPEKSLNLLGIFK